MGLGGESGVLRGWMDLKKRKTKTKRGFFQVFSRFFSIQNKNQKIFLLTCPAAVAVQISQKEKGMLYRLCI